jgi:hypothetical protein
MNFTLSSHQKEQLKDLFNNSGIDFSLLLFRIEHNLKHIDIPTSDNHRVQALEDANLMSEISKTSLKLSKLLNRLDEVSRQKANYVLANQPLEDYCLSETNKYHQKADAVEMTHRLHKHANFYSDFIKGRYGSSKWDRVVDAVCHSWPVELGTEKSITLNCKLVSFFSIILDEQSHDKIHKYILRSSWYWQHFKANTSWQNS